MLGVSPYVVTELNQGTMIDDLVFSVLELCKSKLNYHLCCFRIPPFFLCLRETLQ